MRKLARRVLRGLARAYPLMSGYGTIANTRLFSWALAGQQPDWITLRCGAQLLSPVDDWVGRSLYYFGDLDPKLSWIFQRFLRPGDVVLDIGANLGVMSLVACDLVGSAGRVHAFEPQPDLARRLGEAAQANGYSWLQVHACGLGDEDASLELTVPADNLGSASFVRESASNMPATHLRVPVRNASGFFEELGLREIRLVKMDVEGFEPVVISGAMDFFRRHPPHAIVFELNDHSMAFPEQRVVQLLTELGYRFYNIPRAIFRMHLREVPERGYGHDVLAVRESLPD